MFLGPTIHGVELHFNLGNTGEIPYMLQYTHGTDLYTASTCRGVNIVNLLYINVVQGVS